MPAFYVMAQSVENPSKHSLNVNTGSGIVNPEVSRAEDLPLSKHLALKFETAQSMVSFRLIEQNEPFQYVMVKQSKNQTVKNNHLYIWNVQTDAVTDINLLLVGGLTAAVVLI